MVLCLLRRGSCSCGPALLAAGISGLEFKGASSTCPRCRNDTPRADSCALRDPTRRGCCVVVWWCEEVPSPRFAFDNRCCGVFLLKIVSSMSGPAAMEEEAPAMFDLEARSSCSWASCTSHPCTHLAKKGLSKHVEVL